MRTDICNDLPKCRIIFILTAMMIFFGNNILFAQSNPIYQNGHVSIIQSPEGWQMLHGENVVGHGEGNLDINDLPPAFQSLLDNYAKLPLSVSKKKLTKDAPSLSAQYGPLLRTAWNQRSPYNDLCPLITDTDGKQKRAVTGCTSISSAQVINFFGYCNKIDVSGQSYTKNADNLSAPYLSNIEMQSDGKLTYDYAYSYTPDFEAINSDNGELAKFILALSLAQKARYGIDATTTTHADQIYAFNNYYGYSCPDMTDCETNLMETQGIKDAIMKGWPVIIRGKDSEGNGHSFIVDGYNGTEFHIDYGWGGKGNGWFTATDYPVGHQFTTPHPNIENFAYLKPNPKYLYIKGVGNDYTQRFEMQQSGSNKWSYCQKEPVDLAAGTYEFYFEYADHSIVAPYSSSPFIITKDNNPYSSTGLFVSQAAKITLSKGYKLNFWHNLNMGEIIVDVVDFNLNISGKVIDYDGNPIVGAFVTPFDVNPNPSIEQVYENAQKGRSVLAYPSWSKTDFTPFHSYLTGIDITMNSIKGNPGVLYVAVLDENYKVLWQQELAQNKVVTKKWIHFDFDAALYVTPGETYYLALASDLYESDINAYYYQSDQSNMMIYRIYSSDVPFVKTGSDGSYSYTVDKYWSGKLYAYNNDMVFNSLAFKNVTDNIPNSNFTQTGFTYIDIAGRVLDKDNNPIEGAVVTTASAIPLSVIDQNNPTPSTNGYRIKVEGVTKEFIPTKKYLTQLDLMFFRKGDPGDLHISIIDASGITLCSQDYNSASIPTTTNSNFVNFKFDKLIEVTPGDNYYIKLSADVCNDNDRCNYYYDATNNQMVYQVWGCDDYYVFTDADGKYTYRTDGGFSGTMNAYFQDKTFGTITFAEQYLNKSDVDFIENASSIVFDAALKSITVKPPFKTDYFIGESFDPDGLEVSAVYDNGAVKPIATGFDIVGFNSNTAGAKTITIKYGEFSANFTINVSVPKEYTITYIVADTVYYTLKVSEGQSITAITSPIKIGSEFMGWTPRLPETMPNKNLEVQADWEPINYTLSYNVDNALFGEIEGYYYGDAVTMREKPVKDGYTFVGWDITLETMPAYDVVIKGHFEKNQPTPVANINADKATKVWSNGDVIFIETIAGADYKIIDLGGRVVKSSSTNSTREEINLNRLGIFLVIVNANSYKVLLTK